MLQYYCVNALQTFGHPKQHIEWCWIKFENGQILLQHFWILQDDARLWPALSQHLKYKMLRLKVAFKCCVCSWAILDKASNLPLIKELILSHVAEVGN